jgi:carbon starvation protein
MYALAYKQAFFILWPVFGTANQLLAGLTLIAVSIWFMRQGKKVGLITLIPASFTMITTIFSLFYLLLKKDGYLVTGNYVLALADLCLIALAIGVVFVAMRMKLDRVPQKEY